jgi:hypothetical protein
MPLGHRTIEPDELAILQHFEIRELRDESGGGIVELPLAFFITKQHGDGDNRFGH